MPQSLSASRGPFRMAMPTAVLLMSATALWVCLSGAPLIWDGAYQLVETLLLQKPFVYLSRFHTFILWQPTVWASRHTENVGILTFLYGFPFIIAPAVGLTLSWWMVRRQAPHLILWAVFGTAIAALPGQIFIINDSYFQQHLFWPVFMAVFVPLTPMKRIAVVVLCIAQLVHPIGMALCGGAAITALILTRFESERRKALFWYVGLMVLVTLVAAVKLYTIGDSYARDEFAFWKVADRWRNGVAGWPIRGLLLMFAAAGVSVAQPWWKGRRSRTDATVDRRRDSLVEGVALSLAGLAGIVWIYWAHDARLWPGALDYRRWLVPLTVPFFLAALLDAIRPRVEPATRDEVNWLLRGRLSVLLAVVFTAVLSIQSFLWLKYSRWLDAEVAAAPGPIIAWDDLQSLPNGPCGHWAISSYVMLYQGKTPRKMLAPQTHGSNEPLVEPLFESTPMVPLTPDGNIWPQPGRAGWFDNRPLVKAVRETRGMSTGEQGSKAAP